MILRTKNTDSEIPFTLIFSSFFFSGLNISDYYKRLGRHFCSTCGKEYRWMQSLVRHEREECGKAPQHSCPICGLRIRHKWMLKKHLTSAHNWSLPNGKKIWKSKKRRNKHQQDKFKVCKTLENRHSIWESNRNVFFTWKTGNTLFVHRYWTHNDEPNFLRNRIIKWGENIRETLTICR